MCWWNSSKLFCKFSIDKKEVPVPPITGLIFLALYWTPFTIWQSLMCFFSLAFYAEFYTEQVIPKQSLHLTSVPGDLTRVPQINLKTPNCKSSAKHILKQEVVLVKSCQCLYLVLVWVNWLYCLLINVCMLLYIFVGCFLWFA